MEKVKILWSRDALKDLDEAYEYVSKESPQSAINIITRIEILFESLASHSELGRVGRVKGMRELVVTGTPFILPYLIDRESKRMKIFILGVRHTSRRWPSSFDE